MGNNQGVSTMEIAMVGLGKMGANMASRLMRDGHQVVVYDVAEAPIQSLEAMGAMGARTLKEIASQLKTPRSVWVMVPSGDITEQTILQLVEILTPGDTIIDGGNSNYKDTQRRALFLQDRGLELLDVGTSGGIWGLSEGYSLMVGGRPGSVDRHRPIFESLAPSPNQGWGYVGPSGAGHFVKMIHNGIEYGMMQAYAEGFEILKAKTEFGLDLHQIAEIWRYGSVVRSWLLELASNALAIDQDLQDIKGWVPDSGEGRWTVFEAIDLDIAAPVITLALQQRLRSRSEGPFSDRLLAALRNQFGGHEVIKDE
jgi:6-phosphogluconate dehydrogenase